MFVLLLVIFVAACSVDTQKDTSDEEVNNTTHWKDIPLHNVQDGEEFTIGSFDEPVILESFAVWCPTCTKQQKILKEYHEQRNDFVSISLNTDPNEEESLVREHAQSNGFDWRYAVSPAELTTQLIDEFGFQVVNAPAVPMLLICPNGATELFAGGVKDSEEIDAILASCEA